MPGGGLARGKGGGEAGVMLAAVELGLGVSSPGRIEFITEDEPGRSYAEHLREILLTA